MLEGQSRLKPLRHLSRTITAYVGNTTKSHRRCALFKDHPRVCGEHKQYLIACSTVPGSPPRMQGTRHLSPADVCRKGINPEYAGNTSPHCSKVGGFRITPAYAGNTCVHRAICSFSSGSSPHTQGAQRIIEAVSSFFRITPAYAGSTCGLAARACALSDHPRICEEHKSETRIEGPYYGSSPRMRGALGIEAHGRGGRGIIPAYAGSTFCDVFVVYALGDHPRVCGEYRCRINLRCRVPRIIPAYGSTDLKH